MMAIRMFTWTTINNNNIDHLNIDQKFDNQQPQHQQQNHESLINFYLFKFILKWITSSIATKIATQQSPRVNHINIRQSSSKPTIRLRRRQSLPSLPFSFIAAFLPSTFTSTSSSSSSSSSSSLLIMMMMMIVIVVVNSQGLLPAAMATTMTTTTTTTTTTEPYRTTANLGENVILRCVFDFPEGFRVPYVIQWEKKDVKIPIYIWYDGYHPHIGEGYENRVSLSGRASLNLTNVRDTDQGWYECKVFFLNRPPEPIKNGTWVHLDVLAPPQFRVKPPDVIYVKVGESVTLPCEAYGTPTPQITWYKDNKPLKANSNIQIYNHELQIDNIQLSDIGEYRCTSRNREGSINAITKIIIAGPAVITLPPPRNTTKLQGDRVELVCEARALPSNVTYRWFHDGQEIGHVPWQESRFVIKPGMLVINPSVAEDSGHYTCEVSNGIGSPDTASAYLNIEFPARVYYSPTIQYLPLGLSGIVRCFIQASPPFQFVTWTKDRRPFDPNSTPDVSTINNGSLLFHKVSLEHQGIYRCTPYNVHGTAESSQSMEVLVRDPPVFTRKPKDQYVRAVNDEVSISCDGTGQPKPNIYWRKADGTKLSPRERTTIRSGNITIKLLKKEDHGQYECVLENEIAAIIAPTLLIINNTTPHTPTNVSVNTSYFAATIRWEPNYNGGYEQTFHLSYRISDQGDAEWKTIRVPPPETTNTFTLYNLQSDNEYEFQVYATNRLGAGQPSPIIRSSTKPWSFGEKIYPTDASGATYIPTVQKPSGPKPDAPRNLTFQRMAQGWVLSWHPPLNITVAVAYYRVEYRHDDDQWLYTDPIPYDTAYLFEKLESNSHYIFRVWAYSILGVGEVSPMIEINIEDYDHNDSQLHFRAMIASIIGGFIFFSMSIVLILCLVKVCNKKKRRKIEKSYVMVTCPVNGNACFADNSMMSSKQHNSNNYNGNILINYLNRLNIWPTSLSSNKSKQNCRYISCSDSILRQQYYNDKYYRDYWQRSAINSNNASTAIINKQQQQQQQQQQSRTFDGCCTGNTTITDEYDAHVQSSQQQQSCPHTNMAKCFNTQQQQQSLSINGWDHSNGTTKSSFNYDTITKQPHTQSPSSLSYRTRIINSNPITNINIPYSNKFNDNSNDDDTNINNHERQQYWPINRSNTNNNNNNSDGRNTFISTCDDNGHHQCYPTSIKQPYHQHFQQQQQQWPSSYALCKSTLQSRSLSVPRRRNPMMNMEQVSMMMMMDDQQQQQQPSVINDNQQNDRPTSSSLFQQQQQYPPSIRGSFRSDGSGQSQTCRPFSQQSFHTNIDNHNMTMFNSDYLFKPVHHNRHHSDSISMTSNSIVGSHQQQQQQHHHHHHHYYHPYNPHHHYHHQRQQPINTIYQPGDDGFHDHPHQAFDEIFINKDNETITQSINLEHLKELPALKPIYNYPNNHHQSFHRSTLSENNNLLRATVPIMQRNWIPSRRPKLEPVPEAIYDYGSTTKQQKQPPPPLQLPPRSPRTITKYQSPYQNLPIPRHLLTETLGPKPIKNKKLNSENSSTLSSSSSSSDGQKTGYTRDKLLGAVEKVRSGQYLLSINRDSPYRHSFEGRCLTKTYQSSSQQVPQSITNHHFTVIPHNIQSDQAPRPPPRKQTIDHHSGQKSNTTTMLIQYDSPGQSSGISAEEQQNHQQQRFIEPQYQRHRSMDNISADENYEFDDHHKVEHYHHHQRTKSNPVAMPSIPTQQRPLQTLTSQYYSYRAPKHMSITDIEQRCLALRQEFLHFRQRQAQLKQQQQLPERSMTNHKHHGVTPLYYRPISINDDEEPIITPSSSSSSDGFESLC